MDNTVIQRTKRFRWNSKNSLYNYFYKHYDIGREIVDKEITNSTKTFKQRQGQPFRPAELWQKVGVKLEKNNDVIRELPEEAFDYGITDLNVSPVTLKPGLFIDIGISSIFLAAQYGISLFILYQFLSQSEMPASDSFIESI
jgi:hypothetical protein